MENANDVLISPNGLFSSGFYSVGENAYCFAIWFTKPLHDGSLTIVWMANRNKPINGKRSKLSLLRTGNLVLTDAGQPYVWSTDTDSSSPVRLQLNNSGNLFLQTREGAVLWQSFDSPTDTLLPNQLLTRDSELISSTSRTNYSSSFYKLYYDNDNVLRLIYNGPSESSIYWPDPEIPPWQSNRSTYNNRRTAVLDSYGHFNSSDKFVFTSADWGMSPQRRLTLDVDGNVRVYSLDERRKDWEVMWQAISRPCSIHGICGDNSLCTYAPESGRRCSCVHGHKMKNHTDWAYGCEPDFKLSNNSDTVGFMELRHVDFFGYDSSYLTNYTFKMCQEECLNQFQNCKGFLYKDESPRGNSLCYTKYRLVNGYRNPSFRYAMYVKLPKIVLTSHQNPVEESDLNCSGSVIVTQLHRTYQKKEEKESLKFMLWFTIAFGGFEIICIICFLYMNRGTTTMLTYLQVATGFKRFTYTELKKASRNFSQEIGGGGYGVVYKGILSDNRIAAIKRLKQANQGEAEFLAEVSTIGRLNHMNLIETWGYCVERKHRLLVYEYMANGSLAETLCSNTLDWEKRYKIAMGTAKGLAYLHEECSEWVLHCDVKPQNILLGSNYEPKVADFGLSKLLNRGGIGISSFSRIRGTRGYMAPEWVFNLPITSKVDVYSYGVVMLEMITGRSPKGFHRGNDNGGTTEQRRLVTWVKEKMDEAIEAGRESWIDEIVDPTMDGEYDMARMEILVKIALQCVEEDRDARPTMRQIVDTLLHQGND